MSQHQLLKSTLKRGAFLAAANWQVTLIQATADALLKVLLTVPIIGGLFLVALVLGTEPGALMTLAWDEMTAAIVTALLANPLVLTSFLLAVGVVGVGGSLVVCLVKAGTIMVLVRSEREADPIEDTPLHPARLMRASRFSVDRVIDATRSLGARYARLGALLLVVYLASAGGYLALVAASRASGDGWGATALLTTVFAAWITLVNLVYLLIQIVMAAEDSSVASAARRALVFLRRERGLVARVCLVVLAIVVVATAVSIVAMALLGLIGFVPFVGLAVLPLQLVAWVLRALVFQYIGLTSIGAYVTLYRRFADDFAEDRIHDRLQRVSFPHGAPAP